MFCLSIILAILINIVLTFYQNYNNLYYENIIQQQINSSISYKYPKDASEYQPSDRQEVKDFGTFDFIVIGAGASGSVVANRLSETNNWTILLLEAGAFGNDVTDIPNMEMSVLLSDYNWGYKSVPQETACLDMVGKQCTFPRGKGIGGSTLINNLVYTRCNKKDYDKWAQEGNPGWSYEEVLPYFKKLEDFNKTDPDAVANAEDYGRGGYLSVEYPVPRHPQLNLWLEANKEKGYKIIDYNIDPQIGASVCQLNTRHGRRADGGTAYIKPIRNRENLKILTDSFVTKIAISAKTKAAFGVRFVHNKKTYLARSSKEIILSAGSIVSPQLLMLSGIGPAKHLHQLGIELVEDLDVGSTLRDHALFYGLLFDSTYPKTHKPLDLYVEDYLNGVGSLTTPNYNGGVGFYQTKLETLPNYPDLELMMTPIDGFSDTLSQQLSSAREKTWQHLNQSASFLIYVMGLHSKSVGTIRLKSKNPFDYPLIDSKFLSDAGNVDIARLYEGIQLALSLANTQAFQKYNATLVRQDLPACNNHTYLSESYWYCALRYFSGNVYHPVGTCPMGPDPKKGAVVDAQAKVYGVENLRVIDASIFPFTLSGHTNGPCVMAAEKLSDLIKSKFL
jgi:choline dehydrogenase-like flavoprotein